MVIFAPVPVLFLVFFLSSLFAVGATIVFPCNFRVDAILLDVVIIAGIAMGCFRRVDIQIFSFTPGKIIKAVFGAAHFATIIKDGDGVIFGVTIVVFIIVFILITTVDASICRVKIVVGILPWTIVCLSLADGIVFETILI